MVTLGVLTLPLVAGGQAGAALLDPNRVGHSPCGAEGRNE